MSMETAETPFRTAGRGSLIGFIIFTILFSGGFLRQMRHIFPLQIYYAAKKGSGSFKLMETLNRHLAENTKAVVLLPGQTAEDGPISLSSVKAQAAIICSLLPPVTP